MFVPVTETCVSSSSTRYNTRLQLDPLIVNVIYDYSSYDPGLKLSVKWYYYFPIIGLTDRFMTFIFSHVYGKNL